MILLPFITTFSYLKNYTDIITTAGYLFNYSRINQHLGRYPILWKSYCKADYQYYIQSNRVYQGHKNTAYTLLNDFYHWLPSLYPFCAPQVEKAFRNTTYFMKLPANEIKDLKRHCFEQFTSNLWALLHWNLSLAPWHWPKCLGEGQAHRRAHCGEDINLLPGKQQSFKRNW